MLNLELEVTQIFLILMGVIYLINCTYLSFLEQPSKLSLSPCERGCSYHTCDHQRQASLKEVQIIQSMGREWVVGTQGLEPPKQSQKYRVF